ncbi:MAG: hypothetical protein HY279_12365 [Nitrospinae bacterium]|nr:hypothetical protein [Nitrospinota bacterium]
MIDAKVTVIIEGNTSYVNKIRKILKGRGAITDIKEIDIKGKYYIKEISIRTDSRLQFIRFLDKLRDIKDMYVLSVKDAIEMEKS